MLDTNNIGVFVYIAVAKNISGDTTRNRCNHSVTGEIVKNNAIKRRPGNKATSQS